MASDQWKQLFITIADLRGTPIVSSFSLLPDKKKMSYFLVNYLLINAFYERRDQIQEICGKNYLRVRRIHVDFEYAIHWAFKSWGEIKGCYFHMVIKSSKIYSCFVFSSTNLFHQQNLQLHAINRFILLLFARSKQSGARSSTWAWRGITTGTRS